MTLNIYQPNSRLMAAMRSLTKTTACGKKIHDTVLAWLGDIPAIYNEYAKVVYTSTSVTDVTSANDVAAMATVIQASFPIKWDDLSEPLVSHTKHLPIRVDEIISGYPRFDWLYDDGTVIGGQIYPVTFTYRGRQYYGVFAYCGDKYRACVYEAPVTTQWFLDAPGWIDSTTQSMIFKPVTAGGNYVDELIGLEVIWAGHSTWRHVRLNLRRVTDSIYDSDFVSGEITTTTSFTPITTEIYDLESDSEGEDPIGQGPVSITGLTLGSGPEITVNGVIRTTNEPAVPAEYVPIVQTLAMYLLAECILHNTLAAIAHQL